MSGDLDGETALLIKKRIEQEHISKLYDEIFSRLDGNQSGRISTSALIAKFEKYPSPIGQWSSIW